jgi:uncharacterized membrane protein
VHARYARSENARAARVNFQAAFPKPVEEVGMNRNRRLTSAAVATAAAMLFAAGTGAAIAADNSGAVKIKCYGANACKGQAECKTSMNECKGHNACKGKGFITTDSEKACVERLGRT